MNKSKLFALAIAATLGLSGCAQFRGWTSGMRDRMSGDRMSDSSRSMRTTGSSGSMGSYNSMSNPNGVGDIPDYGGVNSGMR